MLILISVVFPQIKRFVTGINIVHSVIYRRDGTVWPGRTHDLGLWLDKRKYQILPLGN
eukprot:UN10863